MSSARAISWLIVSPDRDKPVTRRGKSCSVLSSATPAPLRRLGGSWQRQFYTLSQFGKLCRFMGKGHGFDKMLLKVRFNGCFYFAYLSNRLFYILPGVSVQ